MAISIVDHAYYAGTGSNNNGTVAVPVPSGTQNGDLLLLLSSDYGSENTRETPGGWQLLHQDVHSIYNNAAVYWRIASSEPASYNVKVSVVGKTTVTVMLALRGVNTANPINAWNHTQGSKTHPAVTTTVDGCQVWRVACTAPVARTFTWPVGQTERWDLEAGSGSTRAQTSGAWADQVTAGDTGTVVVTPSAASNYYGEAYTLAIEPAAVVLDTLKASGASTSAGSAVLSMGLALKASAASASAGQAKLTRYGANVAVVTQAGVLLDGESVVPVRATQAGALVDAELTVPVEVTQAGVTLDADRTPPVQVTQAGSMIDATAVTPINLTSVGIMLDARYRRPQTTYNCWEFHVYSRSGAYLAYLDNAFQTAYLEQLNDCGGGAFVLPAGDAKATAANLKTGNVIRPRYRNVEIGAFSIDDVEEVLVGPGEGADQLLKVSGRGLIGTLDKGLVYPADIADPATSERVFSSEAKAAIWLFLYNEFIARGGGELNMGFTALEDSAGLTWDDTVSINFRAGQTLLDVLRQLTGLGMDVTVDPDRTMLACKSLGRDLSASVVFRKGHNILSSTKKTLGSDLANTVLGAGQDALVESTDATSLAAYGRREVYLPVQNTGDATLVATANDLLLDEYKTPRTVITLEVTAREVFPFFDYDIGDLIRVVIPADDPGDLAGTSHEVDGNYRIYSISIREGEGPCDLRVMLELNSLEAEYLIKLQKALRASLLSVSPSSGSAASLASSSTATPAMADGSNLGDDSVESKHIKWGTALGEVSAADVPIVDAGNKFTSDNVEGALQEVLTSTGTTLGATGFKQRFAYGVVGGSVSDNVQLDNSGLWLSGAATMWRDLVVAANQMQPGTAPPDFDVWQLGVKLFAFSPSTEESLHFAVQLPPDWKTGSIIYPHVHWLPKTDATDPGDYVRWALEYSWADPGELFAAPTTVAGSIEMGHTQLVAHKHYITQLGSGSDPQDEGIDGAGHTIGSMLLCRLYRDATAVADSYLYDAFLLGFDLAYEMNSLGGSSAFAK